ncbi:MAG: N-acetylmuramoyl-L-alanine amidase [Candidatus Gracilibacteria bacterium]
MPRIIIDAGHVDNVDPGAVANNTTEHAEVKRIALYIMEKVKTLPEFSGYQFILVPTDKTLTQKIAYINSVATASDYTISIHLNSASPQATGTEVYFRTENMTHKNKALLLQAGAVSVLRLQDRGVKGDTTTGHGRLGIIRDTVTTSLLIELGFITNISDLNTIHRSGGDAVIEGIRRIFRLSPLPPTPVDLTILRNLEATFDTLLRQGLALTTQEQTVLAARKEWRLRMDQVRGQILAQIATHQAVLKPEFVQYETVIIKEYAVSNHDLIGKLDAGLQQRAIWDANMAQIRRDEKPYQP